MATTFTPDLDRRIRIVRARISRCHSKVKLHEQYAILEDLLAEARYLLDADPELDLDDDLTA